MAAYVARCPAGSVSLALSDERSSKSAALLVRQVARHGDIMIKPLNTAAILARFDEDIVKKVGLADVEAQKQNTLDLMKPNILKARERKVSIEDICEVARAAAKVDGVELTDPLIRAAIAKWEKRQPKKGKVKAEGKAAEVKKPIPSIPAPAKQSLFGQ